MSLKMAELMKLRQTTPRGKCSIKYNLKTIIMCKSHCKRGFTQRANIKIINQFEIELTRFEYRQTGETK